MKRYLLYGLLFFSPLCSLAQPLSIAQLWEMAAQSSEVRRSEIHSESLKAQYRQNRIARLPEIYGEGNFQHNLVIPSTPVPEIIFNPAAQNGEMTALRFATSWSWRTGIQAEWSVFNPALGPQQKQDEVEIQIAQAQTSKAEQNWKTGATLAYTAAILSEHQYQQALVDSAAYARIVEITRARYQAGRESSENYLHAQQEMSRKKIFIEESLAVWNQSRWELEKFAPGSKGMPLSSSLQEVIDFLTPYTKKDYERELSRLELQLSQQRLQAAKRDWLPRISLSSYLGEQLFTNSLRQMGGDQWHGYSYIALSLHLPISGHFSRSSLLRKHRLDLEQAGLKELEQIQFDALQRKQSLQQQQLYSQKIRHLQEITALAEQNLQEKKEAYLAGRIQADELNRAENQLQNARREIWQAQYDCVGAYVN